MGISNVTLYNILRKKLGEEETYELVEFIHTEIKAEMEAKTNIFLTKEDKVELIDRINNSTNLLRIEANKTKTELIIWIVSVGFLQYIMLMITRKFF